MFMTTPAIPVRGDCVGSLPKKYSKRTDYMFGTVPLLQSSFFHYVPLSFGAAQHKPGLIADQLSVFSITELC
eukprot:533772-Pelagomonas_calceolata.AAC.7